MSLSWSRPSTRRAGSARSFAGLSSTFPSSWSTTDRRTPRRPRAAQPARRIVAQRPNQGKGAALRAGFRWALEQGFDAVITLDGDGQHDPAAIPAFLTARTVAGDALVIGCRDFRRMPLSRRLANSIGGRAFSWAVGRDIPDNQSGYRLIDRRLMRALLASRETGFAFEVEMITTCIRGGWPMAWVPIRTIYAGEPSHIRPVAHLASFVRVVREAHRTVRLPLP